MGYSATMSAPHMHAHSLELLKDSLIKGKKALDIGSGSGYLTLCMSKLMKNGKVWGIEHIPELAKKSVEDIKKNHE